jgi:predicted RNA-binding protein YlqC (UPF0109 family)
MTEHQREELDEVRRHLLEAVKAVVDQPAATRVDVYERPALSVRGIVTATSGIGQAIGKDGHRIRPLREWARRRRGAAAGIKVHVTVAGGRGGRLER